MLRLSGLLPSIVAALPIVIGDGFEDWNGVAPLAVDPAGDAGASGIDFGAVSAWSDADRLYVRFETGVEIGLQSGSPVILAIDTDHSIDTGVLVQGIGADFQWRFDKRSGTTHPFGMAVKVPHAAVGLRQAPTHSSTEFEIALDRDGLVAGAPLIPGDRISLAFRVEEEGGDAAPDSGGLAVVLSDRPPTRPTPAALDRIDDRHLRVLTYNVLFSGLFLRPSEFGRILHAISPDVLSLQEIRDHSPEETCAQINRMVQGKAWHVSKGGFIVSRYPISASGSIGGERGTTWAMIAVPTSGGIVDVLVLNPQVPCCEQEAARQEELDRVTAWIRDAQDAGELVKPGTPFIVAGDLNLVGHSRQLRTLLDGAIVDTHTHGAGRPLDWDGTSLADAAPHHTTGRETYTWRGDDSPFAPGRLDFILYTDSVLELAKGFVLWTPDLDAADLERTGLRAPDTAIASDHLPVVADFILR